MSMIKFVWIAQTLIFDLFRLVIAHVNNTLF